MSLDPRSIVCNCSVCDSIIMIRETPAHKRTVVHRIKDRPVCKFCLILQRKVEPDKPVTSSPGRSDRDYHGGVFNKGEW